MNREETDRHPQKSVLEKQRNWDDIFQCCHSERSEEPPSDGMQNANKPLAKKESGLTVPLKQPVSAEGQRLLIAHQKKQKPAL